VVFVFSNYPLLNLRFLLLFFCFLEIDPLRFCSTLLYPVLILFPAFVRFFRWFWEENAVYVTAAPCT
jgi:hypothetical protein